ncbi:uncharacterized protein [Diabrotica undecimpunctata]|uniref:uncharacterized protein n=1 Tax=Diabrotica undecimpunctata TaxID=50387 RepID=UPI003B6358FE
MESYYRQKYLTPRDSWEYPTYNNTYIPSRRTLEENEPTTSGNRYTEYVTRTHLRDTERFEVSQPKLSTHLRDTERFDFSHPKLSTHFRDTERFEVSRPKLSTHLRDTERFEVSRPKLSTHLRDTERFEVSHPKLSTHLRDTERFEVSHPKLSTHLRDTERFEVSQPKLSTHLRDTERFEVSRRKLSGAQMRKLRKMRKQGIDTSEVRLPPRPQNNTQDSYEKVYAEVRRVLKPTVSDRTTTTSGIKNTENPRSKLTVSQRRILYRLRQEGIDTSKVTLPPKSPKTSYKKYYAQVRRRFRRTRFKGGTTEEDLIKKSKIATVTRVKTAVIPKEFPNKYVAENDVKAIKDALTKLIDESPCAPLYEGNRLMDGYYGLICADEESFYITKDYLEKNTDWKVVKAAELPKSTKFIRVSLDLPKTKNEDARASLGRLEKQNPGLKTGLWEILGCRITGDRGLRMTLRIDKDSADVLKRLEWKPYYLLQRANFTLL